MTGPAKGVDQMVNVNRRRRVLIQRGSSVLSEKPERRVNKKKSKVWHQHISDYRGHDRTQGFIIKEKQRWTIN